MLLPRKHRALRPSVMSLEKLAAASNLVPSILPMIGSSGEPSPAIEVRQSPPIPLDRRSLTTGTVAAAQARRTAEAPRPLAFRPRIKSTVTSTSITSAPASSTTVIDARPQLNAIALTPTPTPPPSQDGAAQPTNSTSGGSAVTPQPNTAISEPAEYEYLPGDDNTVYIYCPTVSLSGGTAGMDPGTGTGTGGTGTGTGSGGTGTGGTGTGTGGTGTGTGSGGTGTGGGGTGTGTGGGGTGTGSVGGVGGSATSNSSNGLPGFTLFNAGTYAIQVGSNWMGSLGSLDDPAPQPQYTETVDWGDETPPGTGPLDNSEGSSEVGLYGGHTFEAVGTYTATITVSDSNGRTASVSDLFVVDAAPPPIVSDSGLDARWVGGADKVTVGSPDGTDGHVIQGATWTYSGPDLVSVQKVGLDNQMTAGFVNDPVTDFNQLANANKGFYFGINAGQATFRVDVTYQDGSKATGTLNVSIRKPTLNVNLSGTLVDTPQAQPNTTPPDPQQDPQLQLGSTADGQKPTIAFDVTCPTPNFNGNFAVQQVFTSATSQYITPDGTFSTLYRVVGNNQPKPAPFNLIDPKALFYGNSYVSNVRVTLSDTPHLSMPGDATSATFKASFEDTAMTQGPNNGIWVPNQFWKWSIDLSATNNGAGWVAVNNGGKNPPAAPTPTSVYPYWKGNANAYTTAVQIS